MQITRDILTERLDRNTKVRREGRLSHLSGKLGRGKDENTFTVYQGYDILLSFEVKDVAHIKVMADGTMIQLNGEPLS